MSHKIGRSGLDMHPKELVHISKDSQCHWPSFDIKNSSVAYYIKEVTDDFVKNVG